MALDGFKTIDGDTYYFMPDGHAITNKNFGVGEVTNRYYADENGRILKGLQKIDGKIYYLDEKTGKMALDEFKTVNKNKYCFNSAGEAIKGWFFVGKDKYYANSECIIQTGTVKINGIKYEFDLDGKLILPTNGKTRISGETGTTINKMVKYFRQNSGMYPTNVYASRGAADIETFCKIYYEEAESEGIRAEVAFCQAMKETGWLQFGGDVKVSQCNFAGLGATGGGASGVTFKDVRTGIRAHIQHLKAYANDEPLNNKLVDPRFGYVERGCAPYVEWLGQKENPEGKGWATAKGYGQSIVSMIEKLLAI